MKRSIVFILVFLLTCVLSIGSFAAESSTSLLPKKIVIYLKPDVSVILNNTKQVFRDSKGNIVYPIIYNGSTYLPVRAISDLMKEPIEWDEASKTVFIGKTLSNPNKNIIEASTGGALSNTVWGNVAQKPKLVSAYLKPDVLVMYDFALQIFKDVNEKQIYPIIYSGTTYLPVRAISELIKEPVEWDSTTKTVLIGNGEVDQIEDVKKISLAAMNLISLFEREEVLYYDATAKTTSIKTTVSLDEKLLVAEAISENYLNAQKLTAEIKAIDTSGFTEDEIAAYNKTAAFAESTEYYILVLENIGYLAAQDADYSMLAETFLYFAMESQAKMEEARILVQKLN